ncbi:MAG: divergent polysaccharide deacetylase family protein [Oceanicaulis sp.]
MARFSFPFVQLAAGLGAVAMVLTGQWLGAKDAAEPVPDAPARVDPGSVSLEGVARDPGGEFASRAAASPIAEPAAMAQDRRPSASGLERLAAPAPVRPRLAVIIDDIGHDMEAARALMAAGLPVTLAILPYAEHAPQIAAEARAAGVEVFVHLPMEPVGLEDPGPGAITTALSPAQVAARVEAALVRVPGAAGLNNHMGSRATRDAGVVAALFQALSGRDLIFVDSLTHPGSLAAGAARVAGLDVFERDVFLDAAGADPDAQIDAAVARAVETGQAVAIGHPHGDTLRALERLPEKARLAGVDLVVVSALAPQRSEPS